MKSRALAIPVLAAIAIATANAAAFDLAELMRQLAREPQAQVAYVERKYSVLLAEPLVSTGTLSYVRPDTVEKAVATPRAERFRLEGDQLTVTREGRQRRMRLSGEPLLAAFAASLRGVLSGDAGLLGEHFGLVLAGTQGDWRLEMTPLDPDVVRYVARIVVSGREGRIRTLEVREAGGDRSVLTVD